jgi:hypothetical protein
MYVPSTITSPPKFSILPTPCIYVFQINFTINSDISLNNINRLVFVKESLSLGFVVPCIFKYSNNTPNQMQQSVVTFIA